MKLNFLSFSQHMHITFTGNPPVRSMRWICSGICEEIQPLCLIQPPDCCPEYQPLPFNLQMSQHPKIQSCFLQSLTELCSEQSPDTGSSPNGTINAVFFTMLPNLTILTRDTHHSLNGQLRVLGTTMSERFALQVVCSSIQG